MEEEVKMVNEIKPLTAEGILKENNALIYECLNISDFMYRNLTKDSCLQESTENAPFCMLEDLSKQNKNLHLLKEILEKIQASLFEEGF